MTIPPDSIEGAEYYGHYDQEIVRCDSLDAAVEEWIEHVEWYAGDESTTVVIQGFVRNNDEDAEIPDGCEFALDEVGRVTVDIAEWCRENWPERLEKP